MQMLMVAIGILVWSVNGEAANILQLTESHDTSRILNEEAMIFVLYMNP